MKARPLYHITSGGTVLVDVAVLIRTERFRRALEEYKSMARRGAVR